MSEFTKGPWEYIDASESARHKFAPACIIRGSGREVARFSWGESSPYFPSEEESKSNARLIAAAPELLEALKEVVTAIKITLRVGHDRIIDLGGNCDSPEVMIKGHSEIARAEAVIRKALGQ